MGQKARFYAEIRTLNNRVTGSCYVCKICFSTGEKRYFLVDCGMFQEKENQSLNEILTFNPEEVSFVLVTHNHTDHVGRLPLLYRRGCKAKIYTSVATAMALPINLEDSLRIIQEKAKLARKNSQKSQKKNSTGRKRVNCCICEDEAEHITYTPLFSLADIKETINHLNPIPYGEWMYDEKLPEVRFKLFPNAHLPGAAMILVEVADPCLEQKINLLFLGDWNVRSLFQGIYPFPKELRDIPLNIVTESTYGSTNSSQIQRVFRENIKEAVAEEKVVLLPVISQYRAQEMLWYMKSMKECGEIPEELPIYFCGPLGVKYAHLYNSKAFPDINEKMKDFFPSGLQFVNLSGNCDLDYIQRAIYIATGGMGSNGPSTAYLRALLPCPNVMVQFSSYCAEDTLGRRLMETEDGESVRIGGVEVKKVADVRFTSEFSGHAKADELLEFLSGFKKIKTIMVTHGEVIAKESFATLLEKSNIAKEVTVLDRENYVRLNPWGILEHKIWRE